MRSNVEAERRARRRHDLEKDVFELAVAEENSQVLERRRLNRARFLKFLANRPSCRVVMKTCGSAHHYALVLCQLGHKAVLLPAQYVCAYVRRNKTDRATAAPAAHIAFEKSGADIGAAKPVTNLAIQAFCSDAHQQDYTNAAASFSKH